MTGERFDALVVGAGPNGLAAAIELARHGLAVKVFEAAGSVGGGVRSGELTAPGAVHDLCSAVHPLGIGSPCFRRWPLADHGLTWVHPELPMAHPLDGGRAAVLERSLDATARRLGGDGDAWRRLMTPLAADWWTLVPDLLQPLLRLPRHPFRLAAFSLAALVPARTLAASRLASDAGRALFAGLAAHSILPLESLASSATALLLGAAGHAVGWPFPAGGAQRLADALTSYLTALGGEVETGHPVRDLGELPAARAVLCDLSPRPFLALAGERLPAGYRRALRRFRHAAGVFKLDLLLDGPIPWTADACRRAGTVHVCGTLDEVAASEAAVARGAVAERPFVLVAQCSLFDPLRVDPRRLPAGRQVVWAYCHAPAACDLDLSANVERQIERFAPGFRDRIVARHRRTAVGMEAYNPNYVNGDIGGGTQSLRQVLARPVARPTPYRTPVPGLYLCSASTPPGGGVHGMCGLHAARAALADRFGIRPGARPGGAMEAGAEATAATRGG